MQEFREATVEDLRNVSPLTLARYAKNLPAWAFDWFLHSNDPEAIAHRRFFRERCAYEADQALKRQIKRQEAMKEEAKLIDPKAPIRPIMSIDKWFADDYRTRFYPGCFNDREFIDDCRTTAPILFYPK